jgi:hypothetical protein
MAEAPRLISADLIEAWRGEREVIVLAKLEEASVSVELEQASIHRWVVLLCRGLDLQL